MSPKLRKFVDRLPIMEPLKPLQKSNRGLYYEMRMVEHRQKLHRDLPPTRLWGYNGQFPGPTIEVNRGEQAEVKWINNLPAKHLLPVDSSIHDLRDVPEVRTVTHLHGGETPWDSDGYPEAWFTNNFAETGPFFQREVYQYPNKQRATTLWYHDHAMGITRLNMYAGLAGLYIIRDNREKALGLPQGDYEIPLVIQDRTFNNDGSLFYPRQPDDADPELPDPSITPFFLGDTIVVNGKVWPYLEVEPRKYRFRILNASNTRSYQLYVDSEQSFYQIGSDGGLLPKTVRLQTIAIEPSERMDVILDFTNQKGNIVHLKNDLGPNADPADATSDIMQFRVRERLTKEDTSRLPRYLSRVHSLAEYPVTAVRYLTLNGSTDNYGRPLLLLDNKKWDDPITEKPRLDATEIWSFINVTNFTHPIHLHLIQFQILDRQPFDLDHYNETGHIKYTGPVVPPKPNERGWKDTAAVPSAEITRIIVRFTPFTGRYVWHCHILEHEDYDMMRPLLVTDSSKRKRIN
ncbi:multicopper oxidase family protein [Bacillus piscicola]|uniref:multicopper oxidase family protein n=1 Tax=Bacillus piscicola TaxID=1632684 RepID=UPI001F094714|nr:multicopper oxidase [Bacillus piscicola]